MPSPRGPRVLNTPSGAEHTPRVLNTPLINKGSIAAEQNNGSIPKKNTERLQRSRSLRSARSAAVGSENSRTARRNKLREFRLRPRSSPTEAATGVVVASPNQSPVKAMQDVRFRLDPCRLISVYYLGIILILILFILSY